MKKRFWCLSMMCVLLLAAGLAHADSMTIESVNSEAGRVVSVDLNFEASEDVAGFGAIIEYDETDINLTGISRGSALAADHAIVSEIPDSGKVIVYGYSESGPVAMNAQSGTLCTLNFEIASTLASGAVIDISFADANTENPPLQGSGLSGMTGESIVHTANNGSITIAQSADIEVSDGGTVITEGEEVIIGSAMVGATALTKTLTVTNTGGADLLISNINVPAPFVLSEPLDTVIAAGASDDFTVSLPTDTAGSFYEAMTFDTNVPSQASFTLFFNGSVIAQQSDISVWDGATSLTSGASSVTLPLAIEGGSPTVYSFTVMNSGTGDLEFDDVSVPTGFFVSEALSTIAPGSTDTLVVSLDPTMEGIYTGNVTIFSNDSDTPEYVIGVMGTVMSPSDYASSQTVYLHAPNTFYAGAWDYSTSSWAGEVNGEGDGTFQYELTPEHWYCICLQDGPLDLWTEAIFFVKNVWVATAPGENSGIFPLPQVTKDSRTGTEVRFAPTQSYAASSIGNFEMSIWSFNTSTYVAQEEAVDYVTLDYPLGGDNEWYGGFLYNMDSGQWIEGIYFVKSVWY
ncbi:MAG: choice-of-anchor D domain-containing protein [Candidatus Sumerlaeia bacterium]